MVESKSKILVDGRVADEFIRTPLIDGAHYTAEFTSKQYDSSKDADFLPPPPACESVTDVPRT